MGRFSSHIFHFHRSDSSIPDSNSGGMPMAQALNLMVTAMDHLCTMLHHATM